MSTRCGFCPGTHKCLPVDGPEEARVLFVGEAPGYQEEKKGRVFIGKTGEEVNRHYLPLSGLRRENVRFTNAIRCYPDTAGGKLDPKRARDIELLHSCAHMFLLPEIVSTRPDVIVTLGSFACRALLGDDFNLELQHGFPQDTTHGTVFPMYHPALGIYEPKKMLMIRNDWIRLKSLLKGTLELPEDPYPCPDYREVTDASEIQEINPDRSIACDTESDRQRRPFCLTYSQEAGTGRLIRSSRPDILQMFNSHLRRGSGAVLFHNWFYDWVVTEAMGVQFDFKRIVDTMAEVYRLGNLPQGLKALAYRELGMVMQDFDDLVTPYSREHVLNYYRIAQACEWPKPEADLVMDDKTGLWKLYKPQSLSTKLKRFFTDYSKSPDKDVFLTWDNWESSQAMIESEIGAWPGKCISHVPFAETLFYACRDADALIRLWPVLKRMQSRVRKFPQHQWRAA